MNLITPNSRTKEVRLTRLSKKRKKSIITKTDDDNIEIFHEFEMQIAMNEFDHRILALQEKPEKFPFRPFLLHATKMQ